MTLQFAKGQVFRFGASGNWFSEKGTTNEFQFETRAVPVQSSQGASVSTATVGSKHFDFEISEGVPVVHSITTNTSGAVGELTLKQEGGTIASP